MATVLLVAFSVTALCWALVAVVGVLGNLGLRNLPASGSPETGSPRVSVVIPTRDEAVRLERTLRSVLAQEDVDLEVLVVDDRSTDDTPEILARLVAEDTRLRSIRIDQVPEGWLGKCYACDRGAELATGDWLLFLDADTWLVETVLARTLAEAERDGADHVCLVPGLGPCTLLAQAVMSLLTLGLLGIALGVNRDWRFSYVGIGAFSLFRRTAYRTVGGHRRVRLQVVEDFALGYLVRQSGLRSRVYAAVRDVEVRWAHSVPSFLQVLEKNLFAKLGFRTVRAVGNVLAISALWFLPIWGAIQASVPGLAAAAGMASAVVPAALVARRHGWSPLAGLLAPLSLPLLAWATARSAWLVLRRGGVRWRDTFYPLTELRAQGVRID